MSNTILELDQLLSDVEMLEADSVEVISLYRRFVGIGFYL